MTSWTKVVKTGEDISSFAVPVEFAAVQRCSTVFNGFNCLFSAKEGPCNPVVLRASLDAEGRLNFTALIQLLSLLGFHLNVSQKFPVPPVPQISQKNIWDVFGSILSEFPSELLQLEQLDSRKMWKVYAVSETNS